MDNEQSKFVKIMRNAIKNGNLDVVKELLGNNDGLLETNTVFGSWLHIAASYGRIDIASYLIDCGIDVNRNGDISGGNPIRSAAENGQIEMVELLYNHGTIFDVSEAAKNPLFGAIYGGHYNVVQFLVEHGIDIAAYYAIGELDKVDACEYGNSLVRRKSKDICERNQNHKSRIAEEKTWIFIINCWKKQEKKLRTYGFSEKMLR